MREILFKAKRIDNGEWVVYPECNKYGANKNGEICSFDYKHTGTTQKLIQHTDKDGYKYVYMKINGRKVKRRSHRVVLSCFEEMPIDKTFVNHKNGKKDDNRIENLEWCTTRENVLHAYRVLGRENSDKQIESAKILFAKENNPKAKITEKIAICIINDRRKGMLLREIAKKYNLSVSQVGAICQGKYWNSNIFDNPELLKGE